MCVREREREWIFREVAERKIQIQTIRAKTWIYIYIYKNIHTEGEKGETVWMVTN